MRQEIVQPYGQTLCTPGKPAVDCAGTLFVGVYTGSPMPPFLASALVGSFEKKDQNVTAPSGLITFSISVGVMSGPVTVDAYLAEDPASYHPSTPLLCDPFTFDPGEAQLSGADVNVGTLTLSARLGEVWYSCSP